MTNPPNPENLSALLRSVFGFAQFRANQQSVCEAAVAGKDLLLVMPTGAGKSLCYQLPAIARGGTALVVSPLIALMDDQAVKLASLGLRVARIHSGLDRAIARQACADYLAGSLQFLFIAPERLRVPGFPEMLAKRKLALIAIDEAHCISQWGHDFRPDYRMLGQYLPALRGEQDQAPVIAMTATATPSVQADIVSQLAMVKPSLFIHGFRRENLGIEVVELSIPERAGVIRSLLADAARRPAIVYATSRKQAERLAEHLVSSPWPAGNSRRGIAAAAYHAGLDSETRERVQTAFQAGQLEVVVATIAFGMGIDKADIRTVIHAGLPATLEGYYQEIGRAGRDGAMSRTYLMHSYADQRTHDFFLTRDYPPISHLEQVFRALGDEPRGVDELQSRSGLDQEEFDKALEKLEIHGGARLDFGSPRRASAGGTGWKKTYGVQAQFRAEQFAKVLQFTTQTECRMAALVKHFGDIEDAIRPCGVCDMCDPAGAVLRQFRRATASERQLAEVILKELRDVDYKATGTLQRGHDGLGRLTRDQFDGLLGAMTQAGLIEIEEAEYEKDGEVKRFRKVRLTASGLKTRSLTTIELLISDGIVDDFAGAKHGKSSSGSQQGNSKSGAQRVKKLAKATNGRSSAINQTPVPPDLTPEQETVAARIRQWRAEESKRLRVPAYVVLHDRTIAALAASRPRNPRELLEIDGIGPAKAEKFGDAILRLLVNAIGS